MFENGILIVLGALIGLLVKLTSMPEVIRVREIVGEKKVHLKIKPQQINPFYMHNRNHAICKNFFYRRILINCSYTMCLVLTIASIAGVLIFFSSSQASTNVSSNHTTPRPANKIADLDLTTVKGNIVLSIRDDGTYSMTDVSQGTEMIIIGSDGNVLRIFEGNNILYASLFFGILVAILCYVQAGPLIKIK